MKKAEQQKFYGLVEQAYLRAQEEVKVLEVVKNNPTVAGLYNRAVGKKEALEAVYALIKFKSDRELMML